MSFEVEMLETLGAAASHFPPGDSTQLIEGLITSLDAYPKVEEARAAEVERRNAQDDSGAVALL